MIEEVLEKGLVVMKELGMCCLLLECWSAELLFEMLHSCVYSDSFIHSSGTRSSVWYHEGSCRRVVVDASQAATASSSYLTSPIRRLSKDCILGTLKCSPMMVEVQLERCEIWGHPRHLLLLSKPSKWEITLRIRVVALPQRP